MKKIFSLFVIFLSFSIQGFAQQYINLYQDDVVIRQLNTEEIDSMSVTETEPNMINFWCDGEIFLSYNAADIDSIKVTSQGGAPFSYIGIVGFNDQLYKKEIGILSPSTKSEYTSFVSNLSKKDGTLLYYAVDNALDMLDEANIDSPLKNVHFITFTDGLDQGSLMVTDKYSSSADYLSAMSTRIANAEINNLPVNAYSLGLRGNDVSDMTLFRQNLQQLASSPDNVFEVSSISGLRSKLQDIANQIISVSTRQTMSMKIPGIDSGTKVRFVFDGKDAASSQLYIEGTFDLSDRSLHDVTYHGIKATSGKTVQGTQDGIFVTYTFTGMRLEAGTSLLPTSSVKHYYKNPSSSSWQINSEFSPAGNTQRNVSHTGTAIMLVLDCSSSLGSDFSSMKSYANEFINLIASNAEPFKIVTPTNVKAQLNANDLVVDVSWDAVQYAQSYRVYRSSSSSGTYELVAENVTATSWTDNSPLQGNNYYKACAVGYGLTSTQSSYASVNVILNVPTNIKTQLDENDLAVNVSWDAVQYAQSYHVYRSSSSSGTYELVAQNVTATSWTDNSPLQGNNCYKVCAVGYGLTSTQSSYASVNITLNAPTNVKAVVNETNWVVNLSWDAVKYAQSYNIYRSSSSSGTYQLVAEGVTSASWTDNNPLDACYNYYKIKAVSKGIESEMSTAGVGVYYDVLGYVDLGLPSGTLWATRNIGADYPEDYGDYFAWGETKGYNSGKTNFSWSNYQWCNGSSSSLTKYNNYSSSYGTVDGKTELDLEDDAAYVNWGPEWRMPSQAQFKELINSSYTTTEWTTLNGVKGRKITSKKNGNSIFLPAAGCRDVAGSGGDYWSRSLYSGDPNLAWYLDFYSSNIYADSNGSLRYHGQSVRPVRLSE